MGLLPEFFTLMGIGIFLSMSLLSAFLDDELPSRLQYVFQVAAIAGLGLLLIIQRLINGGVLGLDSTDSTRFLVSVTYLASSVASVISLNLYFADGSRMMSLASTFSGTVTLPIFMISMLFVSSFVGSGGEPNFSPTIVVVVSVSALVISLALFGFLREASRHIGGARGIGLALLLRSMIEDDWEASPTRG